MGKLTSFNINGIDSSIIASGILYDDSSTDFGATNVQEAIEMIRENINDIYTGGDKVVRVSFIFEQGSISSSSGKNSYNTDRLYTPYYYSAKYFNIESHTGTIAIYIYDEEYNYLGYTNDTSATYLLNTYPTAKYIRLSLLSTEYTMSGYGYITEGVFDLLNTEREYNDNAIIENTIVTNNSIYEGGAKIPFSFDVGGIYSNNGVVMNNTGRKYTPDYYIVDDFNIVKQNGTGTVCLYAYDEDYNYLGYRNYDITPENVLSDYPTAKYIRVSLFDLDITLTDNSYGCKITGVNDLIDDAVESVFSKEHTVKILPIFRIGGINSTTGNTNDDPTRYYTPDYYLIENYSLNRGSGTNIICIYVYDEDYNYLGFNNTLPSYTSLIESFPTGKYIRISLFALDVTLSSISYAYIVTKGVLDLIDEEKTDREEAIEEAVKYQGNILYGKKWAVCGDSFSCPAVGEWNTDDDYMPSDSKFAGYMYAYKYIITSRNNMTLQDLALGGRTMALPADGTFTNSFINYYQNIDSEVDYITIYLGINDSHHAPSSTGTDGEDETGTIEIREITDTSTSTFCGAYNTVVKYILENYPEAHLGIIVL